MCQNLGVALAGAIGAAGAIVCLGAGQPALGQTVCDSIGPDVIVGEIPGAANYSSVGGIEAFSIGTTACNIGDDILLWMDNSTFHPVIGQNMFRLKDARFEQIGQAWLKHGFAALQNDACGCGCSHSGVLDYLNAGCSDPYTAGLNGGQGGVGPKFEVNAYTGDFLWPPTDIDNTGDSIYKRLQVKISDLDPTQDGGGRYYVEAQYIAPDDSAAGNHFNNISYRTADISGGGTAWSLALTGATQRELSAIEAWRLADPSVNLVTADVPNDGRFYLGWKVTDLGGGQWDYEFALYNMNADRSAGLFRVPLHAGTAVSSTGFHDVDYHSGEPYKGDDWTVTVVSNEILWETTPHAVDPDANALRWGTLYNFRFVADAAPTSITDVEVGLFKPGTPSTIMIPLTGIGPANDDCANATAVPSGTTPFSNLNATTDGPDEPAACDFFGYTHIESDVWFRYTAPCSGTVTVSLCGSSYDTKLAIYGTNCPAGPGAVIVCNDDFCPIQSEVSFAASGGQQYLIRIGGFEGAQGTGNMTIEPPCGPPGPENDLCDDALATSDGAVPFSTINATTDGPAHTACTEASADTQVGSDIWYDYTATCTGTLTVTTCEQLGGSADYDSKLAVYDGCSCPVGDANILGCNDDDTINPCGGVPTFQSTLAVPVAAGQCYKIRIGGFKGAHGTGTFIVSGDCECPTDVNGDGTTNVLDLIDLLLCFGLPAVPECVAEDINGDGTVNVLDLIDLLLAFGTACPAAP